MRTTRTVIGIDFDNTIICYDGVFHKVAVDEGLVPSSLPASKSAVRDFLRQMGREDQWTELQGLVYGKRICEADPYPGVLKFFQFSVANGIYPCIVSHKTRYPYRGERYDLHQAAWGWLETQGFFDIPGFTRDQVFFEITKEEKLQRIASLKCSLFIDDLPEILSEPSFPSDTQKILFDPAEAVQTNFVRLKDWSEADLLF